MRTRRAGLRAPEAQIIENESLRPKRFNVTRLNAEKDQIIPRMIAPTNASAAKAIRTFSLLTRSMGMLPGSTSLAPSASLTDHDR
jgi:hypothetical protein